MKKLIRNEKGFSIMGTFIALVILSISAVGFLGLGATMASFNAETRDLMVATKSLEDAIERISEVDFDHVTQEYPNGYEESIDLLYNKQGKWVLNYIHTGDPQLLGFKVTAYWQGADGREHSAELVTFMD
jgi:hypothetical protein